MKLSVHEFILIKKNNMTKYRNVID